MCRNYSVYKHTSPSGKVYIGLTGMNPKDRWDSGRGYKNNAHFQSAIKLYGWQNITHEVLFSDLTKEEACELERELIAEYDSTNPLKGYNVLEGGTCGFTFTHTETAKLKISMSSKERWNNDEYREKMSAKSSGENNPFYGKHHTEATREKLKQWNINHPLSEEEKQKRVDRLSAVWRGNTRSRESVEKSARAKWKAVAQYDLNNNLIKIWDSAKAACEELNIQRSSVSQCCNGKRAKAGGYRWKYTI